MESKVQKDKPSLDMTLLANFPYKKPQLVFFVSSLTPPSKMLVNKRSIYY